jgi:hypothetical protein
LRRIGKAWSQASCGGGRILRAEGFPPGRPAPEWPGARLCRCTGRRSWRPISSTRGSVDRARDGDVLHRVRAATAVSAGPGDRLHAVPGRSVRHLIPEARDGRAVRAPRGTAAAVRPRSKVEPRRGAVPWRSWCSRGSDAARRAELRRRCGAVRPVGQGGMLGSYRSARRTALASNTSRVRDALPP